MTIDFSRMKICFTIA